MCTEVGLYLQDKNVIQLKKSGVGYVTISKPLLSHRLPGIQVVGFKEAFMVSSSISYFTVPSLIILFR